MHNKTVALARQLLETVPQDEIKDLIRLLDYYNNRFAEADRVRAMMNGSKSPADQFLEDEVKTKLQVVVNMKAAQASYVTTTQSVCRCCGR